MHAASPPRHATCRYLLALPAVCFRAGAILVLNSPVKVDKPLYSRTLLPTSKIEMFLKNIEILLVEYDILSKFSFLWFLSPQSFCMSEKMLFNVGQWNEGSRDWFVVCHVRSE